MQTHPNVDKALWSSEGQLGLKQPGKAFPLQQEVGVLKWRMQTTDESLMPLSGEWGEGEGGKEGRGGEKEGGRREGEGRKREKEEGEGGVKSKGRGRRRESLSRVRRESGSG